MMISQRDKLVRDFHRMMTLGAVHTVQLNFGGIPAAIREELERRFTDSLTTGILKGDTIYIEQALSIDPMQLQKSILDAMDIAEDTIEGISFYTEMMLQGKPVFAVLEYNPVARRPELLSADQQDSYFELVKLIQTKWLFSDRFIVD